MPQTTQTQRTPDKTPMTDNVCGATLAESESLGCSGQVRCGGCGRLFLPDRSRKKFCDVTCHGASIRVPIEQRFWTKVNKNGTVPAHLPQLGPCWLWTAGTIRGYGQIASVVNGKRRPVYAHRVAWELSESAIPCGMEVLHRCDVPLCVRPDHLFLGTQQDNLADARAKGRLDETRPRMGRLTPEDRMAIFLAKRRRGICAELAHRYGVSLACISVIRKGRFARPDALRNVDPVRLSELSLDQLREARERFGRVLEAPESVVPFHVSDRPTRHTSTVSPLTGQ